MDESLRADSSGPSDAIKGAAVNCIAPPDPLRRSGHSNKGGAVTDYDRRGKGRTIEAR